MGTLSLAGMISGKRGDGRWIKEHSPVLIDRIGLRWRVLSYLVPWLGLVSAFFFLFFPESPAETSDSPLQQSLAILALAPLMAAIGLAQYFQSTDSPSQFAVGIAALCMLGHAGLVLSCKQLVTLAMLLALQVVLLGIAVAGYLHLSHLSSGG